MHSQSTLVDAAAFANEFKRLGGICGEWVRAEAKLQPALLVGPLGVAAQTALSSGGKMVRPVLCAAVAHALGLDPQNVKAFALALECIHNSSLIHDDLPALDDDDFRRGEASCHKRFGEAVAILAGDVLILRAFQLLSSAEVSAETAQAWVGLLADASTKLCNGQILDLAASGRIPAEPGLADGRLEELCLKKTGALFQAALVAPLYLLPEAERERLLPACSIFGLQIGLLFQITDDILDAEQDGGSLGELAKEVNFVSCFGLEGARTKADDALQLALSQPALGGQPFDFIRDFAKSIRFRLA